MRRERKDFNRRPRQCKVKQRGSAIYLHFDDSTPDRKRLHGRGVERADALVNAGSDFGLLDVSSRDHFQAGIEIINHVEGDRLGGLGFHRRAVLKFTMMRGNEVEQV